MPAPEERARRRLTLDTANPEPVFASIDIGSHTIRLLVARVNSNREVIPVRSERRVTRLAADFQQDETLKPQRMHESIAVLREYASLLRRYEVRSEACGATGVVRRARNGTEFLHRVQQETAIAGTILSEEAEAYLSAKGSLSVLPSAEGLLLMFDLGGSSTELILADPDKAEPLWGTSVFIGASTVTQSSLPGDPPSAHHIHQAALAIGDALRPALIEARTAMAAGRDGTDAVPIVGTAGTVTTLAAMFLKMAVYEPYRVNGLVLGEEWLNQTILRLSRLTLASRRNLTGLEAGREDIILGGALIVREILQGFGQDSLTVTDGGLLEGLLLQLAEGQLGWSQGFVSPLTWRLQKR